MSNLNEAVEHLKKGGIVIYPTETAYGIGCDATNQTAVDLIFQLKRRDKKLTLPLIAGSLIMAEEWAIFNNKEKELAEKFWPGPLTLVLPVKRVLAEGCVAEDNTIALRVSGQEIARALSERLGKPIVSTSANLSGQGEIYSLDDLKKNFLQIQKNDIYILDGGYLPKRLPSTIVRITKTGQIEILRQGEIKIENV